MGFADRRRLLNTSNNIRLPDGYKLCEYIESHGQEYLIILGIKLFAKSTIKITAAFTDTAKTSYQSLSAKYFGNPNKRCYMFDTENGYFCYGDTTGFHSTDIPLDDNFHTVCATLGEEYIFDNLSFAFISENSGSASLPLFCRRNQSNVSDIITKGKISKVEAFNANGKLTNRLVPCYKENENEYGLFDVKDLVFYGNVSGQGALTGVIKQ